MKTLHVFAILVLVCLVGAAAGYVALSELSVETAPPVVIETHPRAGSTDVDAGLGEIRVTFSKDMITEKMWSVVKLSDGTFPALAGDVHYVEARTFVIPVTLEPASTYALWLNHKEHDAFRDVNGTPAIPYLLVFQTRK